jgi:hypothetical protein
MNYSNYEIEEAANLGGLKVNLKIGFVADADVIPEVPTNPSAIADVSVIASNIVMKSGKYMYNLEGTLEKLNLKGEGQGERDGKSAKLTVEWFMPGHTAATLGWARLLPKKKCFLVVEDHEGHKRLVGNKTFYAECAVSDDTGKAVADLKGVTFTFTTYSDGPAPIYTGTIPELGESS